jgi:hypothetical protein
LGLSLRRPLEALAEIAGPVVSKSYDRMRVKGYVSRFEKQFCEVIDVLLPPHEALAAGASIAFNLKAEESVVG